MTRIDDLMKLDPKSLVMSEKYPRLTEEQASDPLGVERTNRAIRLRVAELASDHDDAKILGIVMTEAHGRCNPETVKAYIEVARRKS